MEVQELDLKEQIVNNDKIKKTKTKTKSEPKIKSEPKTKSEPKIKREPKKIEILKSSYLDTLNNDEKLNKYEIGVDEAGRGPMFGRIYTAAVILPKTTDPNIFDHSKIKDSKRFHSEKKIQEVAEYIKKNAIAWSVKYEEHSVIDKINIRQATLGCMQKAIREVMENMKTNDKEAEFHLLIDGNDFIPMSTVNKDYKLISIPHVCIEGGDNKFSPIGAASILAKVFRDNYILELCKENPELNEKYDIGNNKGYGTKKHMDGIQKYGISEWHRKSYGLCKNY